MAEIILGNKTIKISEDLVYIIAEIGQNHQGDLNTAKSMILEAKKAGCDCVKFQKSCLTAKFNKAALNRRYDGENSWGNTYGEHKKYLEFTLEQYRELQSFCAAIQIDFTASAMDEVSLQQLDALNVPFIKIGSGDANNFPMLVKASKLQRPLIISTGMQSAQTIENIVKIMQQANKFNYALLHCVSSYPTKPEDCNLQMVTVLKNKFPHIVVGYSGHENGIEITKAAVLMGARIIERHFTLDKTQKGSDHKCSLLPAELQQMIENIQLLRHNKHLKASMEKNDILKLLGGSESLKLALREVPEKCILPCELSCKLKLGKSIVAANAIQSGHVLQNDDICIKVSEPNGIPAEDYYAIRDATLKCNVEEDEAILYSNIIVTNKN